MYGNDTVRKLFVYIHLMPTVELTISYPERYNEINVNQMYYSGSYYNTVTLAGKEEYFEKNVNAEPITNVTIEITNEENVMQALVLNAKEISTSICGDGAFLENLWLVDGTGSYKKNIDTAKSEFRNNRDYLIESNITSKLGISFFTDRDLNFGRPINTIYRQAMPLLDPNEITDNMIEDAFDEIRKMGTGASTAPEANEL